ncbi:MAG: alpha/beta hydrolase [Chitinophagaceae bacterium]
MRLNQRLILKYIRTKFKLLSAISKRKAASKAFELFCTPQYRNKKKLPKIFTEAEILHFPFQQYRITGYRWNKDGIKKVLILHGFESSVINFDRYVKPLIRKNYCVMAFDAPAHGRSTGKTVNVITYKILINHLYENYGPIYGFIAHSFGGLALCLAAEEWNYKEEIKMALIAPATETKTAANSLFQILKLNDEVQEEFHKIIEEQSGHSTEWFSIVRAAQNIKNQVLFLQDKNDNMTPYCDIEPLIEKNYSNFRFIITEGLGHRRIYRDNKVVKAIIDFL